MNKNKLIVFLVLLIAVVGLTMGSVSAKTTTKNKNKVIKVNTKFNKQISKTKGKYTLKVVNGKVKINGKTYPNFLGIQVNKKNKPLKGNKYAVKYSYKLKGKTTTVGWFSYKKSINYKFYAFNLKKSVKVKNVAVKISA